MRVAVWGQIALALTGVWLMLAPAWIGFAHPAADPWTAPVWVSLLSGAFVFLAALTGLIAVLALSDPARKGPEAGPTHPPGGA